jgi:hypothetical protein
LFLPPGKSGRESSERHLLRKPRRPGAVIPAESEIRLFFFAEIPPEEGRVSVRSACPACNQEDFAESVSASFRGADGFLVGRSLHSKQFSDRVRACPGSGED